MRRSISARERPPFPGRQDALTAETGEATIGVTRFSPIIGADGEYVAKMGGQDAHVVLFQMRDAPAHDFKLDGKLERVCDISRGTLHIVDLRIGDASGRLLVPVDTLMFHIPSAAMDEIADDAGASKIKALRAPDPWLTYDPVVDRMAPLLVDALRRPDEGNRLFHDHVLLGLGAHFAHRYGGMQPRCRRLRGGLAPWQEKRAKEMLTANLSGNIKLRLVAQECGLSPDYFSRAFKVSTGVAPHTWLQMRRVSQAKALLDTSTLSLADIAQACGFADQSHFSRVFSRHAGESPA
jgi:AraC family transcriptional regulator